VKVLLQQENNRVNNKRSTCSQTDISHSRPRALLMIDLYFFLEIKSKPLSRESVEGKHSCFHRQEKSFDF